MRASGGMTMRFSPPAYFTVTTGPSTPPTVTATVALVMVPCGARSHGRKPSPRPRWLSAKMVTRMARWLPSAFGVGATPNADGSQRAIRVTIFAESQRGLGEGFRPWDRAPHGTMTNATVAVTVGGVDGPVVTVKYAGGEKRIVIPPDARILAYAPGTRGELKV